MFTITYDASDSLRNDAIQVSRVVTVVDTTPPVITINRPDIVKVIQGETYSDPGATAVDLVDGRLPVTTGDDPIDENATVGTAYVVTYDSMDDAGNHAVQATRTVTVVAEGEGEGEGGCPASAKRAIEQVRERLGDIFVAGLALLLLASPQVSRRDRN